MKLLWTPLALDDLRRIEDWLRDEAPAEIALATLVRIRARADFLLAFPRSGRPYRQQTRILLVVGTSYLIHYRIIAEEVQVLRVHHERQDWQTE